MTEAPRQPLSRRTSTRVRARASDPVRAGSGNTQRRSGRAWWSRPNARVRGPAGRRRGRQRRRAGRNVRPRTSSCRGRGGGGRGRSENVGPDDDTTLHHDRQPRRTFASSIPSCWQGCSRSEALTTLSPAGPRPMGPLGLFVPPRPLWLCACARIRLAESLASAALVVCKDRLGRRAEVADGEARAHAQSHSGRRTLGIASGSIGEGTLVDSVVRASERQRSREYGVFDVFRRCLMADERDTEYRITIQI